MRTRWGLLVCAFLAVFYAAGLTLSGLQHGAIIGLLTGLFSFIPYVGMFVGVAVGITVAVFQFDQFWHVALVAGIFALGQFIEGNFLTPRVVGSRIRLHPVWVMFAVLAGTALFGLVGTFLGVLLAYGLVGPFANRAKAVIESDAAIYHTVKQLIIASLHGHPQPLVIEADCGSMTAALVALIEDVPDPGTALGQARWRGRGRHRAGERAAGRCTCRCGAGRPAAPRIRP